MASFAPKPATGGGVLQHPEAGMIVTVTAGETCEIAISYYNVSPDVANFHLELVGLPPKWFVGIGREHGIIAPPSSGGDLTFQLQPDRAALADDYSFRVQLYAVDTILMSETPLILRVMAPALDSKLDQATYAVVADTDARSPTSTSPKPVPSGDMNDEKGWQNERLEPITLDNEVAATDDADSLPEELSVDDPHEGQLLRVRPGATLLVRFTVQNLGNRENNYVLDEDRTLDRGWLDLVQDQVNLSRNDSGELLLRLMPPVHASPGEYPFVAIFGLQGTPLTHRALVLVVVATPAVQVTTPARVVTVGPFSHMAAFDLEVNSVGNAVSAFRMAVGTALKADDGNAIDQEVYATRKWTYHFDREIQNLRELTDGKSDAVPVSLLVRPRGIWWFGLWERHTLYVAAAPVTVPNNGGIPGNVLKLVLRRWRLVPFPGFAFIVPITILLLLFMVPPTEMEPMDYIFYDGVNTYTCLVSRPAAPDAPQQHLDVRWRIAGPALLKLNTYQIDVSGHLDRFKKENSDVTKDQATLMKYQYINTREAALKLPNQSLLDNSRLQVNVELSQAIGTSLVNDYINVIVTRQDNHLRVTDGTNNKDLSDKVESDQERYKARIKEVAKIVNIDWMHSYAVDNADEINAYRREHWNEINRVGDGNDLYSYLLKHKLDLLYAQTVDIPVPQGVLGRLDITNTSSINNFNYVNYWIARKPATRALFQPEYLRSLGSLASGETLHLKFRRQAGGAGALSAHPEDNTLVILTTDPKHAVIRVRFIDGGTAAPLDPVRPQLPPSGNVRR
jgi:hypothetical protein